MGLRSQRRFISKYSVKTGMMVEFSYTKRDSTTSSYTVLVIDPDRNGHLHGLLIGGLSDDELIKLSKEVGGEFNYDPEDRRAPITQLQSDAAYQRFKNSGFSEVRRYRTFLLDKISSIRQILIGEIE